MTQRRDHVADPNGTGENHWGDPLFFVLLCLFLGSGCSALIYEIIWFQMLQLVIGSSTISLGVLLGTFMGGMCLGSLFFSALVSRKHHPLAVYAVLEFLVGVYAVALLYLFPLVRQIYLTAIGFGIEGIVVRSVLASCALLPPTVLMGATLPAIARWMKSNRSGVSKMGLFYGANIAGAVVGCLLAGFVLLRLFDIQIATLVALSINWGAALTGFLVSRFSRYATQVEESTSDEPQTGGVAVYLAIMFSGMAALGAEVVWTRIQSLLLGATVYTFSIILAVFLLGLGIGSGAGAYIAARSRRPRVAFALCQLFAVYGTAWAGYSLAASLPFWPVNVSMSSSAWFTFQIDLVRSAWAVLPVACCWGACFPLALACVSRPGSDPGRIVGRVYAANTIGAILGALVFSVILIPTWGTLRSQQIIMVISSLSALAILFPVGNSRKPIAAADRPESSLQTRGAMATGGAVIVSLIWMVTLLPPLPDALIGFGRYSATFYEDELPEFLYRAEGINATIAVSEFHDTGVRNFHVSGKIVASSEPVDMRLQRMLGHLPAMIHPNPRSVLIVGCGAGVTSGSFVPYPGIERIVICEIEPLIPAAAHRFFENENHGVFDDPRVKVVLDDARHFIATTREKFDIITSDPIHPWVKGAAALYSEEYFKLVKSRLNPGGIATQWVPLYECSEAAVKSQVTTFMRAFPDGTVWGNESRYGGYDVVLLGKLGDSKIDIQKLKRRFGDPDYRKARESLSEVGLGSSVELLSAFAGTRLGLEPWMDNRYINRDTNFRLQYLAGMGLNSQMEGSIYQQILSRRTYPVELFLNGDSQFQQSLQKAIQEK